MSIGVVMLTHTAFDRASLVARHWAMNGCPVVIHVDKRVADATYQDFANSLVDLPNVKLCERRYCDWGTWSIVGATQDATRMLLEGFQDVSHVFLTSGSCLPLRPVLELTDYLAAHPRTDFIESVTTEDVPWTVGGLDIERFILRFPFSWKTQRGLFDRYVRLQRRIGFRRKIPDGLSPHLGSQWWCLTRQTLEAILGSPRRAEYEKYFKKVWIPDESYFQTMVRKYSDNVHSRSLTLAQFDSQGKPYIFYDDHMALLRRSNCFVARKTWPSADGLYTTFLNAKTGDSPGAEPNPGKIARLFSKATERRVRGRTGLTMQSRFPKHVWYHGLTSAPYSVFEGFSEVFDDFEPWLAKSTGVNVHGHLFAKDKVQFSDQQTHFTGGISDSATLRDYHLTAFLSNLIWNSRGQRQCFQFGPSDNQKITPDIVNDPNAQISVISGAWIIPLFRSTASLSEIRAQAAKLQKIESAHLELLRADTTKAQVKIWPLADFIEAPKENLQSIIDEMGLHLGRGPTNYPSMTNLEGLGRFLQNLKNQGMHPWLAGEFLISEQAPARIVSKPRSYQVPK